MLGDEVEDHLPAHRRDPGRAELNRLEQLWRDELKQAKASEPQTWRAVADVLLNLDEFLTRE